MEKLLNEIAAQEEKIKIKNICGNSLARGLPKKNIEWETDIKKADINQLRNGNIVSDCVFLRTENIKLESINETVEELINSGDESFLNLFVLIEEGVKIIPPIYLEHRFWLDGELNTDPITIWDGEHRTKIARAYGLKEMPIFVFRKRRASYFFTPDKWQFEIRKIEEVDGSSTNRYTCFYAVSKDGKKEVAMPGRFRINKDNKEFLEFEVIHSHY